LLVLLLQPLYAYKTLYNIVILNSLFILFYKYDLKELKRHAEKPLTVTPIQISHVPSDMRTSADRSAGVISKARQMGVYFHRTLKEHGS
jgi:hypothetical protein